MDGSIPFLDLSFCLDGYNHVSVACCDSFSRSLDYIDNTVPVCGSLYEKLLQVHSSSMVTRDEKHESDIRYPATFSFCVWIDVTTLLVYTRAEKSCR